MKIYVVKVENRNFAYGIDGYAVAFSSKEKAEEYVKNLESKDKDYGFEIKECTLDDESLICSWFYNE